MSKHFLLVDGNSLAHANHNATPLTVGDFQVQAIFGFLRSMHALVQNTPGEREIICLWDGRAQWRIDLYPEYKANRTSLDAKQAAHREAFKRQIPFIEKALSLLGIKQYRAPLLEADDLAGYFSYTLSQKGHQVTLVSGDRDWLICLNRHVTWFDPIRDRRVTLDTLHDFTGYPTIDAYVQGKALVGDPSDNIGGIAGMGEKTAVRFLAEHQDVREFFRKVDAGEYTPRTRASKTATSPHPEQSLASPQGRLVFERNVALMDLRRARCPGKGELLIDKGKPNAERFLLLCQRLAFASIIRDQNSFLHHFGLRAA